MLVSGLLESAGIASERRATQSGVKFGGAYEVLVRPEDLEAAQALIAGDE